MAYKKWERVRWKRADGDWDHGTIVRVGKILTVIGDGGNFKVKGAPELFLPSDKPLDEVSAMDDWSVKAYKGIEGHGDSATFSAKVYFKGEPVILAMNDGWGGDNEYRLIDFKDRQILTLFKQAARSWWDQFSKTSVQGPADLWLEWYVTSRLKGIPAKAYIEEFDKSLAAFKTQ